MLFDKLPPSWRPEDKVIDKKTTWPVQYSHEFDEFYGEPGTQLVRLTLPYTLQLSWEPYQKIKTILCHSKVRDSLGEVLEEVLKHYGGEEIKRLRLNRFGGCFNKRKIRGGQRWSMHSWGIALDFDPSRNKLRWGRDKASLAKPEYDEWWKIWEEHGWVSLGRERNFDWMHVQAARLNES
ncbi:MAG: hypothetical protein Kow00127_17480 [Bacteroidales bacterium]